jgi:hypothetical protein
LSVKPINYSCYVRIGNGKNGKKVYFVAALPDSAIRQTDGTDMA